MEFTVTLHSNENSAEHLMLWDITAARTNADTTVETTVCFLNLHIVQARKYFLIF